MRTKYYHLINPIEAAVAPLRVDAVARATKEANDLVDRVTIQLAAADNDMNKCAPYPSRGMTVNKYHSALSRYKLFNSLVTYRECTHRPGQLAYADLDIEKVYRFIEETKKTAAEQYDAFVAKLVAKIGNVSEAELLGNHVWSHSILSVKKADGSGERWKTQMIVNVSKLGKLFNQWPTRKVK